MGIPSMEGLGGNLHNWALVISVCGSAATPWKKCVPVDFAGMGVIVQTSFITFMELPRDRPTSFCAQCRDRIYCL